MDHQASVLHDNFAIRHNSDVDCGARPFWLIESLLLLFLCACAERSC
jgi:hypothetical protein